MLVPDGGIELTYGKNLILEATNRKTSPHIARVPGYFATAACKSVFFCKVAFFYFAINIFQSLNI
jgi:hypothetical protein